MAHMTAEWLLKNQAVTKDEIESWLAGLEARRSAGDFFYSVNRYICRCLK